MKQSHLDASEPKELLALIESAKDEADKQVAIERLANLARDSDTAWEIFLQVCQSPDPSVRLRAAETIGRLYWSPDSYDKRAGRLSELVLRLFDDKDHSVRRAVHHSTHYFPESVRGPLYRAAVAVLDQRAQRHGRGEAAALDYADALVELDDYVQRMGDPEVIREVLIPRLVDALGGGEYWTVRYRAAELLYPRGGIRSWTIRTAGCGRCTEFNQGSGRWLPGRCIGTRPYSPSSEIRGAGSAQSTS